MGRKPRRLTPSGYYHIISRGIGKQILFEESADYHRFLSILAKILQVESFEILAYCLMDNHFHLLVHAESRLDQIIKRIKVSYAAYYNQKYERTGHLFQGRFTSEPVESEQYLLTVVRYIHNNPVKAGICSREKYPWSSWHEYAGKSSLVSTDLVLGLLGGYEGFLSFSGSDEAVSCLDVHDSRRLTDTAAKEVIRSALHFESGTELQKLSKADRDKAIGILREKGLSDRQIERLTGIGRGVIAKIHRKKQTH